MRGVRVEALPTLSVVVPTRNTRDLTLRCLRSLLGSEPRPDQVVVVDDQSSDRTWEAVTSRFPEVECLRFDSRLGFTAAANRGLARARGEVSLLLNSDTELEPPTLSRLLAALRSDPALGVAGADLYYPDGAAQWSGGREPTLAWLFALASRWPLLAARLPGYRRLRPLGANRTAVEWVSGAAMAVRRATWDEIGPLDERFRFYCQDLDFCVRARHAGWTVALVPGFRVLHRHGGTVARERPDSLDAGADPALLWTDLLRWALKHRGTAWTLRARLCLLTGARLRLVARRLASFLPMDERDRSARSAAVLARAVQELRRLEIPEG